MKLLVLVSFLVFGSSAFAGTDDGSGILNPVIMATSHYNQTAFLEKIGESEVVFALASEYDLVVIKESIDTLEKDAPELLDKIETSFESDSAWQDI